VPKLDFTLSNSGNPMSLNMFYSMKSGVRLQ
jgi:hypothetical protein